MTNMINRIYNGFSSVYSALTTYTPEAFKKAMELAIKNGTPLPSNIVVNGDLDFSMHFGQILLPKGLIVKGNLIIGHSCRCYEGDPIRAREKCKGTLYEGITVHGDMKIGSDQDPYLPPNLTVHGTLTIECKKMEILPSGLTVKNLKIIGCQSKIAIHQEETVQIPYSKGSGFEEDNMEFVEPEAITITGDVEFFACFKFTPPPNFTVPGNLIIDRSDITTLPQGIDIKGNFTIIDCWKLEDLPSDLKVGGELKLRGVLNWTC